MQALIYALLPCIFLLDFLRVEFSAPRILLFLPEILSGIAFVLFFIQLARTGRLQIPGRYVLLITILLMSLALGLFVSEATAGPLVGGIRLYGKYFIFFLLPIAFPLTEKQLRFQLAAVAVFLVVQLPVTLLQRFVFYWGESGDEARGTLSTGSMTGIVLMFGLSVVVGMYHHGYLSRAKSTLLGLCFALPPMFADVKGAFVLLPVAILIPSLFAVSEGRGKSLRVLISGLVCFLGLSLFAVLYSAVEATYTSRSADAGHGTSIVDFYRDPALLIHYLAPQLSGNQNTDRVGRVDGVAAPVVEFWGDPQRMMSGLGIGALSKSPFEFFAADQHRSIVESSGYNVALSIIIWEFGFFGTLLMIIAWVMLWRDSRVLSRQVTLEGALALGWLAVVPIFMASMVWKNVLSNNTVMYLFVYFSGVVIAAVYRQSLHKRSVHRASFESALTPAHEHAHLPPILNVGRARLNVDRQRSL